jgi:hypothetical protein
MTLERRDYYVGPEESLWEEDPIPGAFLKLLVGFKQSLGAYSMVKYISTDRTRCTPTWSTTRAPI